MGILRNYVDKKVGGKKKKGENITTQKWLNDVSQKFSLCKFATHIGKFTHTSVKDSVLYVPPTTDTSNCKYVHTSNVKCQVDIAVTNGGNSDASNLLMQPLEDERRFYEHIVDDTNFVREEMSELTDDYVTFRQRVNAVAYARGETISSSDKLLRQVYFPLGDEKYHLLSILPASSLLWEMRRRIDDKKETKIKGLTKIKFGGENAQNVGSSLSSQYGNIAYLLPSFPPTVERHNITLPRCDFFRDTVRPKYFRDMFRRLHDVYCLDRNNLDIRQRARRAEQNIIDRIIDCAYKVREFEVGWSDRCPNLPQAQKIWLDSKYKAERDSAETWREEIAGRFAAWFVGMYERIVGKDALSLGDAEFINLKQEILSAL